MRREGRVEERTRREEGRVEEGRVEETCRDVWRRTFREGTCRTPQKSCSVDIPLRSPRRGSDNLFGKKICAQQKCDGFVRRTYVAVADQTHLCVRASRKSYRYHGCTSCEREELRGRVRSVASPRGRVLHGELHTRHGGRGDSSSSMSCVKFPVKSPNQSRLLLRHRKRQCHGEEELSLVPMYEGSGSESAARISFA